jgi:hypothetical protein
MSPLPLPAVAHRPLALVLLAVIVALTWVVAVQPVLELRRDAAERLRDGREAIARLALVVERQERRAARLGLPGPGDASGQLLAATSDTLAAAALQARIVGLAGELGAVVHSMTVREPQRDERLHRIGLDVHLAVDDAGLLGLVHALETGEPWVLVERLAARRSDAPVWPPAAGSSRARDVQLGLVAFRRAGDP